MTRALIVSQSRPLKHWLIADEGVDAHLERRGLVDSGQIHAGSVGLARHPHTAVGVGA